MTSAVGGGMGGPPKSRQKEQNPLIRGSDKGSKNPKILQTSYMEGPLRHLPFICGKVIWYITDIHVLFPPPIFVRENVTTYILEAYSMAVHLALDLLLVSKIYLASTSGAVCCVLRVRYYGPRVWQALYTEYAWKPKSVSLIPRSSDRWSLS